MKFTYKPIGVCSLQMLANIDKNIIKDFKIIGGCPGNTQAISKLIVNHSIDEVIILLKGIKCGNKSTSCPDQVAKFLLSIKSKIKN